MSEMFNQWKEKLHHKQYVILEDGSEVHISEFPDKSINCEEQEKIRMNSYARDKFIPKLDNQALIRTAKHYLNNCSPYNYPSSTYDESLIHVFVPELLLRLEEYEDKFEKLNVILNETK